MSTVARITAILLIILGLLILASGAFLGAAGMLRAGARLAGVGGGAGRAGGVGGLLHVMFILAQGLMMVAAGEGLYLLAGLARGPRT